MPKHFNKSNPRDREQMKQKQKQEPKKEVSSPRREQYEKYREPAPPSRSMPSSQQARLALKIMHGLGPDGELFARRWMAFNVIYNAWQNRTERLSLMDAIQDGLSEVQAREIIEYSEPEITFYAKLPPGNMRLGAGHPNFRQGATEDLEIAVNFTRPAKVRLAHFVAAIYQVRCNLFHGAKNPHHPRSRELLMHGHRVIKRVLDYLVMNSDTDESS